MKFTRILGLLILFLATRTAYAQGILFVESETRGGNSTTNRLQIDKTHIRTESHATGEGTAFVFDSQAQTIRMINLDKKTYTEMNKAQLEQMRGQASGAMAQMQEQLKNMPPEQRAAVERMMAGRGGMPGMRGAAQPPSARLEYRKTGSDKVGQWACTKYEGYRGQEKIMELCTVDPKEFGLTAGDFDVAKQLAEFMKSLVPQLAEQAVIFGTPDQQGFEGIAVRRIAFDGGKVSATTEIKEFRRESFPASTFDVPSGFRRENFGPRP